MSYIIEYESEAITNLQKLTKSVRNITLYYKETCGIFTENIGFMLSSLVP